MNVHYYVIRNKRTRKYAQDAEKREAASSSRPWFFSWGWVEELYRARTFATKDEVSAALDTAKGFDIHGRNGVKLTDVETIQVDGEVNISTGKTHTGKTPS
jgi:hypothetical protein